MSCSSQTPDVRSELPLLPAVSLSLSLTAMVSPALVLLLPALALSATELLLEPSGGKAVLVDSSLVKRDLAPPHKTVDSEDDQDTLQVGRTEKVELTLRSLTTYSQWRRGRRSCWTRSCTPCRRRWTRTGMGRGPGVSTAMWPPSPV